MSKIEDVPKTQKIVAQTLDGRIIVMDSITFSDERNNSADVLIGASFCGILSIRWPLRVNPKGVICHEAGPGKNAAGINGLFALEALGIPGAVTATMSCRIADGQDMYDNGVISHFNDSSSKLGITKGMRVSEAARRMHERQREIPDVLRPVEMVHQGETGRIFAMGSVTFITTENTGDVICAGSHFGRTSAAYSARFDLAGVICSDAGKCRDNSGIDGLPVLDKKNIPGAAVSTDSAAIGDGMSTYADGVISAVNKSASILGVTVGMSAREAAILMLNGEAS